MKTSVYIALVLAMLAIISAVIGCITEQFELFGCISLICSYSGLLAGLIGWVFLIREWNQQEKEWKQEEG